MLCCPLIVCAFYQRCAHSLVAVWLAEKPPNAKLTYGYHRYEVLGAVTSVFMIWFITGILVYEAIQRTITPEKVEGECRDCGDASVDRLCSLLTPMPLHNTCNTCCLYPSPCLRCLSRQLFPL